MIDAEGIITALDDNYAIVQMDETGCGRCHEQGGCGGNNMGKIFCSTPRTFRVLNPGRSPVGARVRVTIADGAVSRSALYAYGFPLFAMFAGAIGGSVFAGEPGSIAGAFSSLLCAWFLLKRLQSRNKPNPRFEARIHICT